MSRRACIGLGSNLGERRAILENALRLLSQMPGITLEAASSYRETAPVGGPGGQGPFLNAAATLQTSLEAEALLDSLVDLEAAAGRVRTARWGERTLDLDLLLYEDLILDTADLALPHPRFALRRFVLAPLSEIAPDVVDPMTGQTAAALLANLDRRPSRVVIVGERRAASVSGRLARLLGGAGWRVQPLDSNALENIARWPESDRPTFIALVQTPGPGWSRRELAGRIPSPVLWLDGLTDTAAITAEIVAACEASRTG